MGGATARMQALDVQLLVKNVRRHVTAAVRLVVARLASLAYNLWIDNIRFRIRVARRMSQIIHSPSSSLTDKKRREMKARLGSKAVEERPGINYLDIAAPLFVFPPSSSQRPPWTMEVMLRTMVATNSS